MRKIFEALIYNKIDNYINLYPAQQGFKNGASTLNQLVNLEALITSMKCNNFAMAFLDVKKAYDTVDRKILWRKVETCEPPELKWTGILKELFDYITTQIITPEGLLEPIWFDKGLA